ncbi:MAG: ribbon-helix-helix domain-containing protein [Chloroflexota bacterium]
MPDEPKVPMEPSPEEAPISVRINPAQLKELERLAKETGRSKSDLIREAINQLIGVYNAAKPATKG